MKWFLCLPALSEFCWLLNEIPKFRKKWKKKFFLFPWQGADGSEDAFMGTRVTRDRVSDNLESMIIFSFPGLWCYIGSSTIVTGFKTGFLIINSSLFRGVQGVVWLIIVEVERRKIRRVISINHAGTDLLRGSGSPEEERGWRLPYECKGNVYPKSVKDSNVSFGKTAKVLKNKAVTSLTFMFAWLALHFRLLFLALFDMFFFLYPWL